MRSLVTGLLIMTCATAGLADAAAAGSPPKPTVAAERAPAVAGPFYPADPARLDRLVKALLAGAPAPQRHRPIALVSPHAGYVFSGQIAADAFRQAMGRRYDVIVVLAPNHTVPPFDGAALFTGSGFRTPLGLARVDAKITAALIRADPAFVSRSDAHATEHAVEAQLPFVQTVFPGTPIVAAVLGSADPALCARLGRALATALKGRKPLIVASSDLSHYPGYDEAVDVDRETLAGLVRLDPIAFHGQLVKQLRAGSPALRTCACGEAPILVTMTAAAALGATRAQVISYANSGDTSAGDLDRVVGYGAVVLSRGSGSDVSVLRPAGKKTAPLTREDKKALLRFARRALTLHLTVGMAPAARGFSQRAQRRRGAFVTLKKKGDLRGCIGRMADDQPLARVVGATVLDAALHDSRFRPVRADELDDIEIEISALTPFKRIPSFKAIVVGRDGVVLGKDGRRAVFLPQVAPEQGWDRDQMLDHLCQKATLPTGCWRSGAELSTFQADVFNEAELGRAAE